MLEVLNDNSELSLFPILSLQHIALSILWAWYYPCRYLLWDSSQSEQVNTWQLQVGKIFMFFLRKNPWMCDWPIFSGMEGSFGVLLLFLIFIVLVLKHHHCKIWISPLSNMTEFIETFWYWASESACLPRYGCFEKVKASFFANICFV